MTPLLFSEKVGALKEAWDASALQPSLIQNLSLRQIGEIVLRSGRQTAAASELFDISGPISDRLEFVTNILRLDGLGQRMNGGRIISRGDVGDRVGQAMKSGEILVQGNVGACAAAGLSGGRLLVSGNAGNHMAGVSAINGRSMRGGEVIVAGSVGDELGLRMRRGIIYVGGSAGRDGATRMIAGTIIVGGDIGGGWCDQMRRGSIVLLRPQEGLWAAELSESFEFELSFLPLLWNYLRPLITELGIDIPTTRWALRQIGDLACDGKGEVLTLSRLSSSA